MASTSCAMGMDLPILARAQCVRLRAQLGSSTRRHNGQQCLAALSCASVFCGRKKLNQQPQARHRWHCGVLRKVKAQVDDASEDSAAEGTAEPELPAEAGPSGEAEALAEEAVEVAGTLVDLIEAADINDEVKEQLRGPASLLLEEVSSVRGELVKAEDALRTANERFLRLNADFDNYRKRTTGEKEVLKDRTRADTVKELLAVIDSFEMAKGQLKPESEGEKRIDGSYQGVYKQMVEVFRSLGVEAVAGVGSPFDPEVHDAIMREDNDEVPDGTVLKEFRRGFRLGAQLLRPAMVQVSVSDKPAAPAATNGSGPAAAAAGEGEGEEAAEEAPAEGAAKEA